MHDCKTHSQNDTVIAEFPARFKCIKAQTFIISLIMSRAITLLFVNDIPGKPVKCINSMFAVKRRELYL
jgi:hypothetical protein